MSISTYLTPAYLDMLRAEIPWSSRQALGFCFATCRGTSSQRALEMRLTKSRLH